MSRKLRDGSLVLCASVSIYHQGIRRLIYKADAVQRICVAVSGGKEYAAEIGLHYFKLTAVLSAYCNVKGIGTAEDIGVFAGAYLLTVKTERSVCGICNNEVAAVGSGGEKYITAVIPLAVPPVGIFFIGFPVGEKIAYLKGRYGDIAVFQISFTDLGVHDTFRCCSVSIYNVLCPFKGQGTFCKGIEPALCKNRSDRERYAQ